MSSSSPLPSTSRSQWPRTVSSPTKLLMENTDLAGLPLPLRLRPWLPPSLESPPPPELARVLKSMTTAAQWLRVSEAIIALTVLMVWVRTVPMTFMAGETPTQITHATIYENYFGSLFILKQYIKSIEDVRTAKKLLQFLLSGAFGQPEMRPSIRFFFELKLNLRKIDLLVRVQDVLLTTL